MHTFPKRDSRMGCLGRRKLGHGGEESSGVKRIGKAGKPRLVDNSYFDTPYQDSFRLITCTSFGSAVKRNLSLTKKSLSF